MKYYELSDDINFPNRWYLGDVLFSENWELTHSLDSEREYEIQVYLEGIEMDYTCNEAYGVSVVSNKFKEALQGIPEVLFAKANIIGSASNEEFFVMAVPKELDCVDEAKSEFQKFVIDDPVRPDKAGEYRGFFKLVIDPARCSKENIFRIKGFNKTILVSEAVKQKLEQAGVTGANFKIV